MSSGITSPSPASSIRGRDPAVLVLVVAAIAGPKILLYLPIWLLGVATFYVTRHQESDRSLLSCSRHSLALIPIVAGHRPAIETDLSRFPPDYSNYDFVLAIVVAANLLAASQIDLKFPRHGADHPVRRELHLLALPLSHAAPHSAPRWGRRASRLHFVGSGSHRSRCFASACSVA